MVKEKDVLIKIGDKVLPGISNVNFNYDLTNSLIKQQSEQLQKQREGQVIDKLIEKGYLKGMHTVDDLKEFIATRCKLHYLPNKITEFYVDDKLLTYWDDNYDIKIDGTTVTVTVGL